MPQGACNWHADCRDFHQSLMFFSTISHIQYHFREFGSKSIRPHNRRPHVWHRVGERFADVNVVNRVTRGGVMVWAGISYGQPTQLHFMDGKLHAQRYRDKVMRPIIVPLIRCHHMFQHENAQSHVARICTQFLESMACKHTRHVTHWECLGCSGLTCTTADSSVRQYPATSF
jgi:hypothetical protein